MRETSLRLQLWVRLEVGGKRDIYTNTNSMIYRILISAEGSATQTRAQENLLEERGNKFGTTAIKKGSKETDLLANNISLTVSNLRGHKKTQKRTNK